MKNIILMIPGVLLLVVVYYLFKISTLLAVIVILAIMLISIIKLLTTSYRDVEAIKERTCYKCGSKMILRTAQTGKYKGKKFYGCSKYPECDCMIDINVKPISLFYRKYRKVRKQIFKRKEVPLCDKCGSKMVLRTAMQGTHKGNNFYGCSRYPECKNVVDIKSK